MDIISQVTSAMQTVLTKVADTAAIATGRGTLKENGS